MRPVNIRNDDGRAFCGSCYFAHGLAPREQCADCGAVAVAVSRRGDGTGICSKCYKHPKRKCGICGRVRRVALRVTDTSPDICPTCFQAPEITCSLCGQTALGRRFTANGEPMCFRCQATKRVDRALTGADGTIPEALKPVRDAIVSVDNPRSILNNFTRNKTLALLTSIARGDRPLSHDSLDEHAGRHSVEHLRSLLVAAGALRARDEYMFRLQRFAAEVTSGVEHATDRRLLEAFTRWHLLARLRLRATGDLTPGSAYRCRYDLTAARWFLEYLRDRSRDLATCRQDDIDTWFQQRPQHEAHASRTFLSWARRQRHLTDVQVPKPIRRQPKHFRDEDQRWDLARSMLHDETSASTSDRVAACLVLLYAQPAARIVPLTCDHVRNTSTGTVELRLGGQ